MFHFFFLDNYNIVISVINNLLLMTNIKMYALGMHCSIT